MNNDNQALLLEQYRYARKKGLKELRHSRLQRQNAYLPALDQLVNELSCSYQDLGTLDVPAELIVGTRTSSRHLSFARNFMPIMDEHSEFAYKWMKVVQHHLSETGITDPPEAYEYLGKFYIGEGNKRVSVLKSYGAAFITLDVRRLIPERNGRRETELYYEFLDFYKDAQLYSIQFSRPGYYDRLIRYLDLEKGQKWSRRDQIRLEGFYERLCNELKKKKISANYSDCLVALLEMYTYDYLTQMSDKTLDKIIADNRSRLLYGKGFYNIMCLSDQEDQGLWSSYVTTVMENVDFIISAGDLKPEYLEYIVTMTNKPLFYIHGNHDDNYDLKPPGGCICIDDDLIVYQGIRILGLGGSYRYSNAKYQYTELEMERRIRKLRRKIRKAGGVDIVVTHAPIRGYGDLPDYAHQGFVCFEKLLEDLKPRFWFYGHVHMNYSYDLPRIQANKGTLIVNVSERYLARY